MTENKTNTQLVHGPRDPEKSPQTSKDPLPWLIHSLLERQQSEANNVSADASTDPASTHRTA